MQDLNLIMNFITAARAIAEFSDDSHFELTLTTPKGGEQVIKVDVLSADDTTELEDKHWNECRQIAHYDDELRQAKAEIERLKHALDGKIVRCIALDRKVAVKDFVEALKAELSTLSKVNLFGNTFSLVGESFVDKFVEKYEKGERQE